MERDAGVSGSDAEWAAERFGALVANVERTIRGKTDVVRLAMVCLLAEGHLLLEDVPGTGKTSLAKAMAASIDGSMRRIQFTPDLLPTDVTGAQIYNVADGTFEFRRGGVFANVVLADEINRASPKTQSALLEAMQERQVTLDSVAFPLPRPSIVIATQNPVEFRGTYPLPEAQIDRFMMRLSVGYPDHRAEVEIVEAARAAAPAPQPVASVHQVLQLIEMAHRVHCAPALLDYVVTIVRSTRSIASLRLGVSPRGSLALSQAAQTHALCHGRAYVTATDVKALAPHVLGHRMLMGSEAEVSGRDVREMLDEVLVAVPVPQDRW